MKNSFVHGVVLVLALSLPISLVRAQSGAAYPDKPVSIMVPFAPGGGNDILARALGASLEGKFGQPFVVLNRQGAGGNIGADYVVRSNPDGYNLLLATNTLTINPAVTKSVPFDVRKDLAPVALIGATPFLLVVNPSLPVNSVAELVAYAKAHPGKLSYGSTGTGTPHHLGMEMLKSMAHIDMVHIPYKGSLPALTDVSTGEVQLMFITINSAMSFVKAGKVRAIAVGEPQRLASLPDVPTVAEAGVPGFVLSAWYGVFAPARTPPPVLKKLEDGLLAGVNEPETATRIRNAGFEVTPGSSRQLELLVREDLDRWAVIAKAANVVAE